MDGRDVQKDAKNNALHVLDYECDAAQVRVRVRVRLGASSTGRGYFLPYLPTDLLAYLRGGLPTCLRTTYLRTHLPTYQPTYSPSRRISAHGCSRGSSSPSPTCAWSSTRSRTRAARGRAEGNPGRVRSKDSIEERSMRSCTIVMQLCRIFGGPTRRGLFIFLLAGSFLLKGYELRVPSYSSALFVHGA